MNSDSRRSGQDAPGTGTTVEALLQAMIVWDQDNYGHCRRSAEYAVLIGREMGFGEEALENIRIGTLLHDIGKIGVDLALLRKPGRLDADELERVRMHPAMGADILGRVLPAAVVEIAAAHHEQPDGGGYPDGLRGDAIPVGATICRVADVLDSLTTNQTYRTAMSLDEALDELQSGVGSRYGEAAVAALVAVAQRQALQTAA